MGGLGSKVDGLLVFEGLGECDVGYCDDRHLMGLLCWWLRGWMS